MRAAFVFVFCAVVLACSAEDFPPVGLPTTCAATLCVVGSRCEEFLDENGVTQARCVPTGPTCATVRCGSGQKCVMQKVECVMAPCYPQAVCVDVNDQRDRPGSCPAPSGLPGICVFGPDNCLQDSECPTGQKCCSEGCGKICMPAVKSDVCQLPVEVGPCKASITRYYFDSDSNECKTFIYGGCEGNKNNFLSKEDCEAACFKYVCQLPVDMGPCEAAITRYYFDSESNECKTFIYGGCEGNKNNFLSKEDCEAACFKLVKPGRCPKPVLQAALCPANGCKQDGDCKGQSKCCETSCGTMTCQEPVQQQASCATVRCRPGYECVQRTVYCIRAPCPQPPPTCEPVKPGSCPRMSLTKPAIMCYRKVDRCQGDYQCSGDLKCCRTRCGKQCQKPDTVRTCALVDCATGYTCVMKFLCDKIGCSLRPTCERVKGCPVFPAWVNPNCLPRNTCSLGVPNSCPPGTLCCSTDCGRRCVNPV